MQQLESQQYASQCQCHTLVSKLDSHSSLADIDAAVREKVIRHFKGQQYNNQGNRHTAFKMRVTQNLKIPTQRLEDKLHCCQGYIRKAVWHTASQQSRRQSYSQTGTPTQ